MPEKWIPVSGQMPDRKTIFPNGTWETAPVLIAYKKSYSDIIEMAVAVLTDIGWSVQGVDGYEYENDFDANDLIAWMPLPEPPHA